MHHLAFHTRPAGWSQLTRTLCGVLALGVFGASTPAQQAAGPTAGPTALTPAQWKDDLTYLMATVKAVHPAPFHRVPESAFDAAAAALERDLPRLTDQQVVLRMTAIVALLNDGHSRLNPAPPFFTRDKCYPVRIGRFADGFFVVAARPERASLVGMRVVTIGNRPAGAVWDSLMSLSSGDNEFSRMSTVPLFLSMPELMSSLGLSGADSLVLTVLAGNAAATTRPTRVAIGAVDAEFNPGWLARGWDGPAGAVAAVAPAAQPGAQPLAERHRSSPYWYAEDGRTLYAQINGTNDSRDTVVLGATRGVVSLVGLARDIMARVEAGAVDRVVLDLRYNGGGNNELAKGFVARIAATPRINERGRLFVVTGRETYSAAMNFTSLLEERTAAIFVGEAPGGAPLHYGDAMPFTLPNSKLTVRVSTLHWDLGVRPSDVRIVMEPDLPAPPRYADLRAGIDAPMDAIRRYHDGDLLADRLLSRYRSAGMDSAIALYDATHPRTVATDPWSSDAQQLLRFAESVIGQARERADIFRAYELVTTRFPGSAEAWVQRARVHAFVGDWPSVVAAYAKARELRPQSDFIRRGWEAARRR